MMVEAKPDKAILAELRNWLQVAHEFPRSYRRVFQRITSALGRYAPALVFLVAHEVSEVGRTAERMLTEVITRTNDLNTLLTLHDLMPQNASALAKVGQLTTARLLQSDPRELELNTEETVTLWNQLSQQCVDADQFEDALRYAEIAARLVPQLAFDKPRHKRLQVTTLLCLTQRLCEHQKHARALRTCGQARTLVASLSDSGRVEDRELGAQTTVVWANLLAEQGRIREAVEVISAAGRTLNELPRSDQLRLSLAITQLTLAKQLTRLEQHEAALPLSESAERFLRVLAAREPDQYLDLACAASVTYAQNLLQTGKPERAQILLRSAAVRLGGMTRRQPKRFGADFTGSLIALSHASGKLGRFQEALATAQQAVQLARATGVQLGQRDWYLEGKASENFAYILYRLDDLHGAEKQARAAVRAFGRLQSTLLEGRFLRARALRVLAEIQGVGGRPNKRTQAMRTARRALRGLARSYPEFQNVARVEKAYCQSTLATCLENTGRLVEAVAQERASLNLRRKLFAGANGLDRAHLACSLHALARRLWKLNHLTPAKLAADEAIAHYEAVLALAPESITHLLAEPWRTRAEIFAASHQFRKAFEDLSRAIQLVKPYYLQAPDLWRSNLLPICDRYAEIAEAAGVNLDQSLVGDLMGRGRKRKQRGLPAGRPTVVH